MIYTVTFNPCLDYIAVVEDLELGMVNRTKEEKIFAGGKGINVSIVLNNLGVVNTALGFTAGFTGAEIEERLNKAGCFAEFIRISNGMSRINVKIKAEEETEVNGRGPEITPQDLEKLYTKLDALKPDDTLVLAGSIPASMPLDIYEQIMERLSEKKIAVIVDATGDLLLNVLKFHPFLIKPNHHELEEIVGKEFLEEQGIVAAAGKLLKMGARNVLVSMAGKGAVLVAEDGMVYQSEAPKGKVLNSTGAGDSMVAGFLAGYLKSKNFKEAFMTGIAAGSASAFSSELASKKEVESILESMENPDMIHNNIESREGVQ